MADDYQIKGDVTFALRRFHASKIMRHQHTICPKCSCLILMRKKDAHFARCKPKKQPAPISKRKPQEVLLPIERRRRAVEVKITLLSRLISEFPAGKSGAHAAKQKIEALFREIASQRACKRSLDLASRLTFYRIEWAKVSKMPNKAAEPTPGAGTPRATEGASR